MYCKLSIEIKRHYQVRHKMNTRVKIFLSYLDESKYSEQLKSEKVAYLTLSPNSY